MMTPAEFDLILDPLVDRHRSALLHEAAMSVWGLNFNAVTRSIDVLAAECVIAVPPDLPYQEVRRSGVTVRIWNRLSDGATIESAPLRWDDDYRRYCIDPERELEEMPCSPDFRYMLEMRAHLAEVLYFDKMSDEELSLFHKYVRGD